MALRAIAQRRRRAQQQVAQTLGFPAPTAGLMANTPIYGTDAASQQNAIWLWNLIPGELGLRVRPGSREYATNIPGVGLPLGGKVKTLIYFNDTVALSAGGQDFIFAATDDGIFDITDGGEGPHAKVLDWPIKTADAGWINFINFTNVNGDHFILACDEANGYYTFNVGGGGTWQQGNFSDPNDPDPEDMVDVIEWATRTWFVERNSAKAWYTNTTGGIGGNLTAFDFGSRFLRGGHLVQLMTWSVDDGAGLDDRLIAISSEGDVVILNSGFAAGALSPTLVGRFTIGKVPDGRRVMKKIGSDVWIVSVYGVLKATQLLTGEATLDSDADVTKNVTRYFRLYMRDTSELTGWSAEIFPQQGGAIFTVPRVTPTSVPVQFFVNLNTGAWCMFRNLDMVCMLSAQDTFGFGTTDGRVMFCEGTADNVPLAGTNPGGRWTREAPSDVAIPAAGGWNTNVAETLLRVAKLDADAGDRSAELLAVPQQSIFKFAQEDNPNRSAEYKVVGNPVDEGTYVSYEVNKVGIGANQVSGTWTRLPDGAGDPATGQFITTVGASALKISVTTSGVPINKQAELQTILPSSTIRMDESADADRWVEWLVTTAPVTQPGQYVGWSITQTDIGPNGTPRDGFVSSMLASTGGMPIVGEDTVASLQLPGDVNYDAIDFSLLTHYWDMGAPASWKRVQFIRPSWIGDADPIYYVQARYDFDIGEIFAAPPFLNTDAALWDDALWDISTWAGRAQSYMETIGAAGMGRHVAIALRGRSAAPQNLIGFDLAVDAGGFL